MRASVAGCAKHTAMTGCVTVKNIICFNSLDPGMAHDAFGLGNPGDPAVVNRGRYIRQVPVAGDTISIASRAHMAEAPAAFSSGTRMAVIAGGILVCMKAMNSL